MSSQMKGKDQIKQWVMATIPSGSNCLDVGACDGVWWNLLHEHLRMDAIEVWVPNIETHHLLDKYGAVFGVDVRDFRFSFWYDLIIFGDIIEHMSVEDAQKVIERAYGRCEDMIIAVPFRWTQVEIYGYPYERHIQDDLTHEIFMERYPGFEPLVLYDNYGYYHKDKSKSE